MTLLTVVICLVIVYMLAVLILRSRDPELKWNWTNIDLDDIEFPDGFIWGVASASHQVEGDCDNNNWHEWEQSVDSHGKSRIRNGEISGKACEHWNRYREDIALMKELGVSSYRFSVEWSKIEPENGRFDPDAIQHYSEVIDALIEAGIEPMVTIYHFTHPIWFKDLGGFEQESNIELFVRFGEKVFESYSDRVKKWCTINEIEVETTESYFMGAWPPGKTDSKLVGIVMANLLEAHTRLYRSLKRLPNGDQADIGLVKNIMQFDPWRPSRLLDNVIATALNRAFNTAIFDYLITGTFKISIPGLMNIRRFNPDGIMASDFLGLNYYSHLVVKPKLSLNQPFETVIRREETPADMDYSIYPEGFYRAIKQISKLGLPVYITENGIADEKDDRRADFIRKYIFALSRALRDGADVRGYYYWSLMDNFEWAEGYHTKFGLYAVDFTNQKRSLRTGSKVYIDIVAKFSSASRDK